MADTIAVGCNIQITRTWTAEDDCGRTSSASQVITSEDTTDPVLAGIPANITVECDAIPAEPIIGTDITASDNCDSDVTITLVADTISVGCNVQITRTWTAEDDCGRTSSASQVITSEDLSLIHI